ncbi:MULTISPECIES: LysR family transcriptional regulator [Paraburkholderia]|uniref:LysR family transcriptional regulator n=1 Tax=Paraburkholderia TaxID=1822464 RepID=UPI00078DB27E|nr:MULTISPECIES: LysR family transcriptional regulator [Paraburkholderia]AMV45923.1 LysR family transcriptional regulator [Paraburkholderia caribensis]CAG9213596.1 LysR family transcriptional regulator [Paraburkholderia caribensis]
MNFTHLAAFDAVAQTGSVTAAAERLHVSQPALTREIRELEERLGVALFDRMPRGMQLTEAGRMLAEYAGQIFRLADAAEAAVAEFAGLKRGHLVIASSHTIGTYLMPALMDAYRDLYPGVTIELVISNTEQVKSAVLGQRCQLGLIEGPYGDDAFDVMSLGADEIVAVAGPDHPLSRRRRLNAASLSDVELVMREKGSGTREVVEQAYAAHELTLEPGLVVGSQEAIKRLLRIGHAVSWVSRLSVRDELEAGNLVELPISDIRVVRQLNMLWRKNQSLTPAAKAFHNLTTGVFT